MMSIPMNCARGSVFNVLGGMAFSFLFSLTGGAWVGWFPASLFPKVPACHTDGVCGGSSFLVRSIVCWPGLTLLVGLCSGCWISGCCVMMCWRPVLYFWTCRSPLLVSKMIWVILGTLWVSPSVALLPTMEAFTSHIFHDVSNSENDL